MKKYKIIFFVLLVMQLSTGYSQSLYLQGSIGKKWGIHGPEQPGFYHQSLHTPLVSYYPHVSGFAKGGIGTVVLGWEAKDKKTRIGVGLGADKLAFSNTFTVASGNPENQDQPIFPVTFRVTDQVQLLNVYVHISRKIRTSDYFVHAGIVLQNPQALPKNKTVQLSQQETTLWLKRSYWEAFGSKYAGMLGIQREFNTKKGQHLFAMDVTLIFSPMNGVNQEVQFGVQDQEGNRSDTYFAANHANGSGVQLYVSRRIQLLQLHPKKLPQRSVALPVEGKN